MHATKELVGNYTEVPKSEEDMIEQDIRQLRENPEKTASARNPNSSRKRNLFIVSNQNKKVFPSDFFENINIGFNTQRHKPNTLLPLAGQGKNFFSNKERKFKINADHNVDFEEDKELIDLIEEKENKQVQIIKISAVHKKKKSEPIMPTMDNLSPLNIHLKQKNNYGLKKTDFEMIPEEDEEKMRTEYESSRKFFEIKNRENFSLNFKRSVSSNSKENLDIKVNNNNSDSSQMVKYDKNDLKKSFKSFKNEREPLKTSRQHTENSREAKGVKKFKSTSPGIKMSEAQPNFVIEDFKNKSSIKVRHIRQLSKEKSSEVSTSDHTNTNDSVLNRKGACDINKAIYRGDRVLEANGQHLPPEDLQSFTFNPKKEISKLVTDRDEEVKKNVTKDFFDFSKLNINGGSSNNTTPAKKPSFNGKSTFDFLSFNNAPGINQNSDDKASHHTTPEKPRERKAAHINSYRVDLKKPSKPNAAKLTTERSYSNTNSRSPMVNRPTNLPAKSQTPPEQIRLPAISTSRRKVPQRLNDDITNLFKKADSFKEDPVIQRKLDDIVQNISDIKNVLSQKTKSRFNVASAPGNEREAKSEFSRERFSAFTRQGDTTNPNRNFLKSKLNGGRQNPKSAQENPLIKRREKKPVKLVIKAS